MSTDAEILRALRQSNEGSVSGADLSARLGVSRAAIWARIEELRALGYDIQAGPHKGYQLLSSPDVLHGDDLMSRVVGNKVVGREVRVFEKTDSTNDVIEKLARDGVKEGFVVLAESQTKGRGRLGRTWVSPARKGLWMSVLLRPRLTPQAATRLTVASATALARAIREITTITPEIKWPNDLLVRGKKIAGILTEMSAELDTVKYVIVGVGVNVNLETRDFPPELRKLATSLAAEQGKRVSRPDLAAAFLRELDRDYAAVCGGNFEALIDEWMHQCTTIGQQVRIQMGGRVITGRAESLDADGALLLRTPHGRLERIIGGDVTMEK